jgi:hypothetical protein
MRHLSFPGLALTLLALAAVLAPGAAQAQEQPPAQQALAVPSVSLEKLTVYASAYTEIASLRDQYHTQFARPGNKTHEAQAELRAKLREEILKVFEAKGLTEEEYARITWALSVDSEQMAAFTRILESQKGSSPPASNGG